MTARPDNRFAIPTSKSVLSVPSTTIALTATTVRMRSVLLSHKMILVLTAVNVLMVSFVRTTDVAIQYNNRPMLLASQSYIVGENPLAGYTNDVYTGIRIRVRWLGSIRATLEVSDSDDFSIVRSSHASLDGSAIATVPIGATMYYRVIATGCGGTQISEPVAHCASLPVDNVRCYVSYYVAMTETIGELYYAGLTNDFGVETETFCDVQYPGAGCGLFNYAGNQLAPLADTSAAVTGGDYLTAETRESPVPDNQGVTLHQPPASWYDGDFAGVLVVREDYLNGDERYYEYNDVLWSRLSTDIADFPTAAERTEVYFGPL